MDMHSRNQYLQEIQREYLYASKGEKGRFLDEAVKRTRLNRKHLICKLSCTNSLMPKPGKKRASDYDGQVKATLVKVWELFDYPCGQRLAPILREELLHLVKRKDIICSEEVIGKLLGISPPTIDRALAHEREVRHLSRHRASSVHPLLYQKIPVKLTDEWDREEPGNCQLDYEAHCGQSSSGDFIHSLSAAEITFGWWEGQGQMGRSQKATNQTLNEISQRLPFALKEIHPDNDSGMINDLIWRWTQEKGIDFSRSRPNKKNDNAWVEQRNWTHVRKLVGYLRYDTEEELTCLNELYQDFVLWRNFFLPTMKLVSKERVGGKIHRKYDTPKTPYGRILASDRIPTETKKRLRVIYESLNPVELKSRIEKKRQELYRLYQKKMGTLKVEPLRKQAPRTVRSFMTQPIAVRLGS